MESKLHHNAILTGYLDLYCLICERLLRAEDVFNHINQTIHKKNLDAAPYVEIYKDEHIRKVQKGYYCEFCNIPFTTITKVNLHVAEATHIQNKGAVIVKRIGNFVVALNDVCINKKAWNGFIGDVCALCNLEFFDENIHKTEQNHVLNLIQRRVVFVDKTAVYRMVDKESFQCLTCNTVVALNMIETHFNDDHHKEIFQKCRTAQYEPQTIVQENDENSLKNSDQVQKAIENSKLNNTRNNNPNKSTFDTPYTQKTEKKSNKNRDDRNGKSNKNEPKCENKSNVNLTVKMKEAMGQSNFDQNYNGTDKKPRTGEKEEAENVALNTSEVPKHFNHTLATYNPTGTPTETSSKMPISDQAEFAKKHELTYNMDNNNTYCRLCSVRFPASLKTMKEHVNGMNHKNKANAKTANIPKNTGIGKNRTVPMHQFVTVLCSVGEPVDFMILNTKLCLQVMSFLMITNFYNANMYRCLVCEINFTGMIEDHALSLTHLTIFRDTLVVQNLDVEFIREVRSGLFHCGFCHLMVGVWNNVLIHLQSEEHLKKKIIAGRRLSTINDSVSAVKHLFSRFT